MTRFVPTIAITAALVLSACSTGTSSAPTTTDPGPTSESTSTASQACQDLASDTAQAHGDRVFVEAGGTLYAVNSVRGLPNNRVIVATSVDQPDLVGYPQVQFLSECAGDELTLLGGYVPIDGNFELLFTTEEGSAAGDVPMIAP
ncbi:MAG: hypothetical protein CVT64_04765 [Actinobacteria bacterium HGW-Actinobacteria-4]|nr:MAG: hypothetical protein CVT64_04765 [Actinobacteria bacterium HGW-Actinobacteria-4]